VCGARFAQALLASSHLYHEVKKNAASHGVMVDGVKMDLGKMMEQKETAVAGLTKGIEGLFKKYKARALRAGRQQALDRARRAACSVVTEIMFHVSAAGFMQSFLMHSCVCGTASLAVRAYGCSVVMQEERWSALWSLPRMRSPCMR